MTPREAIALLTKPKSKYGNRKVEKNGETFDSVREYKRHLVLLDMEKKGEIFNLQRQYPLPLVVEGEFIATYIADWRYLDMKIEGIVIEDAKGFKTPEFKLKWKLARALYPGIKAWRLS